MAQQLPTSLMQPLAPIKTEAQPTSAILTGNSNQPLGPSSNSVSVAGSSELGQGNSVATIDATVSTAAAGAGVRSDGGVNKNDPKSVEQSVAKLKQFLKNLVKLAEGRKKDVQDKVQAHVQHLLAGTLSEEQFADNLEKDLKSPHQPNLLPFLKASVPHLRAALLQQRLLMDHQRSAAAQLINPAAAAATSSGLPPTNRLPQQQLPSSNTSMSSTVPMTTVTMPTVTMPMGVGASVASSLSAQHSSLSQSTQLSSSSQQQSSQQPSSQQPSSQQQLSQLLLSQQQAKQLSTAESRHQLVQQHQMLQLLMSQKQLQQPRTGSPTKPLLGMSNTASPSPTSMIRSESPDIEITGVSSSKLSSHAATGTSLALTGFHQQSPSLSPLLGSRQHQQASGSAASRYAASKLASSRTMANGTASPDITKASKLAADPKAVVGGKGKASFAAAGKKSKAKGDSGGAAGDGAHSDEEDEEMELAGVNIQEESMRFLPPATMEVDTSDQVVEDTILLSKELVYRRMMEIGRAYGISLAGEGAVGLLSHATEEYLRNIIEKLAVITQHRMEVLKEDDSYEVVSQVREQLKVLENIDRAHTKRKQELERETILKAAKSKSKSDDPDVIRIKERAKQMQMEEEEQIRKQAANETALSAIGVRRKRPAPASSESQLSSATGTSLGMLTGSQPKHKRRVTIRDFIFLLEQERHTRKSQLLYRTLLK